MKVLVTGAAGSIGSFVRMLAQRTLLSVQTCDVPDTWADIGDLERDVGFRPETGVEQGVRAFVEWYREYCRV